MIQTDDNFITSVTVHPDSLSDHHRIELKLRALKPAVQTNAITKRDLRNIDADVLRSDITYVCSDMCACTNDRQTDELVNLYNTCLTDCLEKHAPRRNMRVQDTTPHPSYDTDINVARNKKRKQENVWRRTKLEIHRQLYVTDRDECTALIGHQTKDVVSLTVLMCLIEQRAQRSQRFVVLLRKRACWILCLQIRSLTTSPVLCLPSHGSQMLLWTRE